VAGSICSESSPTSVGGRQKAHERDGERARIQDAVVERLRERAKPVVAARGQDGPADLSSSRPPAGNVAAEAVPPRKFLRSVEGDPAEQLGVEEVPSRSAHLPDATVRLAPATRGAAGEVTQELPRLLLRDSVARGKVHVRGVQDLAEHVELILVRSRVADAYRPGAAVPWVPRSRCPGTTGRKGLRVTFVV